MQSHDTTMGYTQAHKTQEYLQLIATMVAKHKQRTYQLMQSQPGHAVLDVGCGPATDTIELVSLVVPRGRVVGVDHAQKQIDLANQKSRAAGVEG